MVNWRNNLHTYILDGSTTEVVHQQNPNLKRGDKQVIGIRVFLCSLAIQMIWLLAEKATFLKTFQKLDIL